MGDLGFWVVDTPTVVAFLFGGTDGPGGSEGAALSGDGVAGVAPTAGPLTFVAGAGTLSIAIRHSAEPNRFTEPPSTLSGETGVFCFRREGCGYDLSMSTFVILVLTIIAVVLLGLQAFGVGTNKVSLGWLGLAVWAVAWAGVHAVA